MPGRYTAVLCAAVVLCGCGSADEPADQAERAPPRSVIGDPLQQSLDRAEAVQDTVDARARELRERLEESEGN